MTAKEYYKKYPLDPTFKVVDLFKAFNDEALHMLEVRNVTDNAGVQAIIVEQNNKWNELCGMYITKSGYSRLNLNGFRTFWINRMIEAKQRKEEAQ